MTLPRKNSRTIRVDKVRYRWMPSLVRGSSPPIVAFICHEEKEPADSILEVQLWEAHCSIITPEIAEVLIREARRTGWDPTRKGKFMVGADAAAGYFQGA